MVYTLTVQIEGEGVVLDHEDFEFSDGDTKDYTEGSTVTLTTEPDDWWKFDEWTGDETGTDKEITFDITVDMTITSVLELDLYVTEEEVRAALNDISEEELSSNAIIQKLKDGEYYADKKGLEGYEKERFIRSYAALKSFLISNTYSQVDFGDIRVKKEWLRTLEELERELEEIASESLVIDDTFMFDERPSERLQDDSELVEESYHYFW